MENKNRDFLKYSGLGFQIAATVILGVIVGQWLDKKFETDNSIYTLVFSILMIFVALYQLFKMMKK